MPTDSQITVHMAASLDGFVARQDGTVDWMETADEFAGGEVLDAAQSDATLKTIDCYVMGSKTYETALAFHAKGLGWVYGDKPTFVLTRRELPKVQETVEFHSGDLASWINSSLKPRFRCIWVVGGGQIVAECIRLGLVDEIRYTILPILIGGGISFFAGSGADVPLHLSAVNAYKNGIVELTYQVKQRPAG